MVRVRRRGFLGLLAAWAVVPSRGQDAGRRRLPLAFSTLGCPGWDLVTILDQADRLGYAAVELRGLQGEMDLTRHPELRSPLLKDNLDRLAARGLRIACLGSSAELHEREPMVRRRHLDEARRFIDLANALNAAYVRVFPDSLPAGERPEATIARIAAGLRSLGEHAAGTGVTVLLESHGDFSRSPELLQALTGAGSPNLGLLWDAHHTVVFGHETPHETLRTLRGFVRHTHLKDSRPEASGVRYVLTGEGTVPVKETVRELADAGYSGYYCYEWEKAWHPELEDPELAFAHYARTMAAS